MPDRYLPKIARLIAALACLIGVVECPAFAQNIIEQWSSVQAPSASIPGRHIVNTERVLQQVTLTTIDLIGY